MFFGWYTRVPVLQLCGIPRNAWKIKIQVESWKNMMIFSSKVSFMLLAHLAENRPYYAIRLWSTTRCLLIKPVSEATGGTTRCNEAKASRINIFSQVNMLTVFWWWFTLMAMKIPSKNFAAMQLTKTKDNNNNKKKTQQPHKNKHHLNYSTVD